MATTTLAVPKKETPAETMLRVGTQNLAATGQFTPTPVTGTVTRQGAASTLPTGFGADLTGKIFRYDASGGLAANSPAPAPSASAPSSGASLATPSSGSGGTTYAQWKASGGGSSPSVQAAPGIMSQDQYMAKYGGNVDEAAVRESVRQRMQAQIDAVNSAYDAMSREQSRINQGNLGSTRAVTARSGTLGSDFGNASLAGQEQANAKALAAIEAQRALETSKLYGEVDAAAEDAIMKKKQEAKDQAAGYSTYLDSERQKALDYAKTLGASGLSVEDMKAQDPAGYARLLGASGGDDMLLNAVVRSAMPGSAKTQYETKVVGNRVVAYGVDPATGQLKTMQAELPAEAAGNEIKVLGDELWSVSPDGRSATRIASATPKDAGFTLAAGQTRYGADGKVIASVAPKPDAESGFTLGAGQARYDAAGNLIASGPAKEASQEPSPTSYREWELAGKPGTYADWLKSAKAPTADQAKVATFADRLTEAEGVLSTVEGDFTGIKSIVGKSLPNILQTDERQKFEQAKRNFINATLRRESGAAISPTEFESADKQYFAQPGDSKAVLDQKRANRQTVIEGFYREAGPAGNRPASGSGAGAPPSQDEMEFLRSRFPGVPDSELMKASGFNQESQTSLKGTEGLGELSARYESGGDPGRIGRDSTGGWSYGKYQLAHSNAQRFVRSSPYAADFKGIEFNSDAFRKKWQEVAARDPEGFERAQHEFIGQTHFAPQERKLADAGLDLAGLSKAVRDVVWSTAVQHGPNTDIVKKAFLALKPGATEADLVRKIYEMRWGGGNRFARSTDDVRKSVYNRFFGKGGELESALARLKTESTYA